MKLHILSSYFYRQNIDWSLLDRPDVELLVDSGAFSAHTQNKEISLTDYIVFIKQLKIRKAKVRYFNLDVMFDEKASRINYERMRKEGLTPIPVFTRNSTLDSLRFYDEDAETVAIGGIAVKGKGVDTHLHAVHDILDPAKTHWLGFVDHRFMLKYHPSSVDSTNWISARRFGRFSLWKNRQLMPVTFNTIHKYLADIENLGYDIPTEHDASLWNGSSSLMLRVAISSYLTYTRDIQKAIGTRIHLAIAGTPDIKLVLDCWSKIQPKGAK